MTLFSDSSYVITQGLTKWTERPNNPIIVVQGVNNTNITLTWTFGLEAGFTLLSIFFVRNRPGKYSKTDIASRPLNYGFSYHNNEFIKEYRANLPSELVLLDVNNEEEYVYTIEVQSTDQSHSVLHKDVFGK